MGVVAMSEAMRAKSLGAEDKELYRLWSALPDHAVDEQTAFELFEQARNRPGDHAWASGMLITLRLLASPAVIASRDAQGNVVYQRSEKFPELPTGDNGPGSAAFNAYLDRQHEETRLRNEEKDRERRREVENSPAGRERRELIALITETIKDQVDVDRITILEARVRLLTSRLQAVEGNRNEAAA